MEGPRFNSQYQEKPKQNHRDKSSLTEGASVKVPFNQGASEGGGFIHFLLIRIGKDIGL